MKNESNRFITDSMAAEQGGGDTGGEKRLKGKGDGHNPKKQKQEDMEKAELS